MTKREIDALHALQNPFSWNLTEKLS